MEKDEKRWHTVEKRVEGLFRLFERVLSLQYTLNLSIHSINNNHTFPNLNNVSLLKHIYKGPKMNLWENMEIYKHKTYNKLINEQ